MRLLHPLPTLYLTSLALLHQTIHAINLSQFQPISGFPPACTYAYDAEINNCIASDFSPTRGCSDACIEGLQTETAFLQKACAGVSASQTELIGKFLAGSGIAAVCRQPVTTTILQTTILQTTFGGFSTQTTTVPPSTSTVATSRSSSTVLTVAVSSSTSSTVSAISSPSSTSSTVSASQSTSTAVSSSTSSTASTAISSVPSAIPISSASPSSTSTTVATPTFMKTAVNKGTAIVFTSKAEQTASNNPDAFGGGGSPFEVGVVASSATHTRWSGWGVASVILGTVLWMNS